MSARRRAGAASGASFPPLPTAVPAAVGEEAITHRGEPVARDPARLGACISKGIEGGGGSHPSPAPPCITVGRLA